MESRMIYPVRGYGGTFQPEQFKTEAQLQNANVLWFHNSFPQWRKMLFHVDNNSWNSVIGAQKKALGVVSGPSDLIFVSFVEIFFLELKLPGQPQSPEQKEFMEKVQERGWTYLILEYHKQFQRFILNEIVRDKDGTK